LNLKRRNFIKLLGLGAVATGGLYSLANAVNKLEDLKQKFPVLFIGHGSPLNAVQNNEFTRSLTQMGRTLKKPRAILCISAHWMTKGTFVHINEKPKMIYDIGGFPGELYKIKYPAPGSSHFARLTQTLATQGIIRQDSQWGFDHGNWSVMKWLFPQADVPLFQMSLDYTRPAQYHYELSQQLIRLRKKGVLVIGSGNITHNLNNFARDVNASPVEWAQEFDEITRRAINKQDHKKLINYQSMGASAKLAIPEPSHWLPLIYALGLQTDNDSIDHFYEGMQHGTFSMRSLKIG